MYEPKNRSAESLPVLELRVDHAGGSRKTCPNGFVACAIWSHSGKRPDLPESFLSSDLFDIKAPEPIPELASIISGKPALRFRADDVEIALEPEELYRLASHALRRNEYFALRDRFGLFHEIHEDYYDPDSGVALQPMFEDEYEADQAVR